jgi:CRP-like cAMP-binding protein
MFCVECEKLAMFRSPQSYLENARRSLAKCILFRGLVTGERDAVVARARIRHFAAGDTIFLMGSPGTSMMAVLNGRVRISVPSPEGREIILASFSLGKCSARLRYWTARSEPQMLVHSRPAI